MTSIEPNDNCTDPFRPVFIVGASRSGTTMMGRIVGNSKDIFTFHELHFFEQLWSPDTGEAILPEKIAIRLGVRLLSIERDGYFAQSEPTRYFDESTAMLAGQVSDLSAPQIFKLFLQYESSKRGSKYPCDQTPRNVFYLDEIFRLYPGARVINMIRDPRNVLLSQKKKWRRRFLGAKSIPLREAIRAKINYHPIVMSRLWRSAVGAANSYSGDSRVQAVFFEELLARPEQAIMAVCEFLKIPYSADLLDIPCIGSSNAWDQSEKRGVDCKLAKSYKKPGGLSNAEIYWCQKINNKNMKEYGYAEQIVYANPIVSLFYLLVLPVQLLVALAMNIRRMKNILSTIKKRLQ